MLDRTPAAGRSRPGIRLVLTVLIVAAAILVPHPALAASFRHGLAELHLTVTGAGVIEESVDGADWRDQACLFNAGLWVGAMVRGEARVTQAVNVASTEWQPAPGTPIRLLQSREGLAGGHRDDARFDADDDGDGRDDEDFLDGADDDGDGAIDEDYAALGDEMASVEFNDDDHDGSPEGHRSMGLVVRQRSLQWSHPALSGVLAFDFEIENTGPDDLEGVAVGLFADTDIGPATHSLYWSDDRCGFTRIDTTVIDPDLPAPCAHDALSIDLIYGFDVPDNGIGSNGGDGPGYVGIVILDHPVDPAGIDAPVRVGMSARIASLAGTQFPPLQVANDWERYDLLSRPRDLTRPNGVPGDISLFVSTGPIGTLQHGGKTHVAMAILAASGLDSLRRAAVAIQLAWEGRWIDADLDLNTGVAGQESCLPPELCTDADQDSCTGIDGRETRLRWVPSPAPPPPGANIDGRPADLEPPPSPEARAWLADPAGDHRVILQWDNRSELARDPLTGADGFVGYRVWRADAAGRSADRLPAPDDWSLLAEYRRDADGGAGFADILHPDRDVVRRQTAVGPLYEVGRYEWSTTNVLNGMPAWYAVTGVARAEVVDPAAGGPTFVEIAGVPAAGPETLVVPAWSSGTGCADIRVIPNPYRGGAEWDQEYSPCFASGTKIALARLPAEWSEVAIHTLAGDRVATLQPGNAGPVGDCAALGGGDGGTAFWDLLTDAGHHAAAGIYLYVVHAPGGDCRGRFVVIR